MGRRTLLAAAGTAGLLAVAACTSQPDDDPTTSGAGEGAGGVIADVSEIPVGGAIAATTSAGDAILLTQPTAGQVHAFSSICTHAGCTVEPGDGDLSCPCHGSRFDLATGDAIQGPATDPLPKVAIAVGDDGAITG